MHSKKVAKKLGTAALTGALSLGMFAGDTLPFFGTTVYAAEEKTQAEDGTPSSDDKKDDAKKDDTSKDDSKKNDSGNKGNDSSKDDSGNKGDDATKDDSGNKGDDSSKGDTGNKGDDVSKGDTGNKGDDSSKGDTGNKGNDTSKGDTSGNKGNGSSGGSNSKNDTPSGTETSKPSGSSSGLPETTKPSGSSSGLPETTKPSGSSSGLPETTMPSGSTDVVPAPDASKLPQQPTEENKDDENLSDEEELKKEEEIAKEEDDDDGEGNEELISHQTIIHLPKIKEDFRFFTVARVYGFAKDKLYIYEEMNEKAEKVGELKKNGLVYVLKEEDGWYYVESGDVRGFVKKKQLYIGDKAQEMLQNFQTQARALAERRGKEYTGISHLAGTATALVDWTENDAFAYYRGTTGQTVVEKVYALALKKTTVRDSKSDKGKAVGKMQQNALCYVIADQDQPWVYIESGKVRGFVKREDILIATTANQLEAKITKKGSSTYKTASQSVDSEDNKALYYTLTSIKSGTQTNSIRNDLLKYAAQYAGNPYKWGGSSLTHGTDCSGFAMRVYQKFGYKLPRTSRAQSHCGTKVAVEDARPGDLIFYAKKGRVYHVAIYAGEGKTIEAANEKLGICSLRANRKNAVWAVHLIRDENENKVTESDIDEKNTSAKDQGKLLGDYRITYYSFETTETEKAGSIKDTTSTLIEGNTVAVSESIAKEGEELIINGHLYTATNSKTNVAEDEMAIYVSSTEKEQTLTERKASVYKAKG